MRSIFEFIDIRGIIKTLKNDRKIAFMDEKMATQIASMIDDTLNEDAINTSTSKEILLDKVKFDEKSGLYTVGLISF
jgi:hypothetical protein